MVVGEDIFRSDLGDNDEGGTNGRVDNGNSPEARGDDDVEIIIGEDGQLTVRYKPE